MDGVLIPALDGPEPAFRLPRIEEPSWRAYLLMPLVAVIAALIGVGFQRTTLALRGWMRKVNLLRDARDCAALRGIRAWGYEFPILPTKNIGNHSSEVIRERQEVGGQAARAA